MTDPGPFASLLVGDLSPWLPAEGASPGGHSATRALARQSDAQVVLASHRQLLSVEMTVPADLEPQLLPGRGLRVAQQLEAEVRAQSTATLHGAEIQSLCGAPDSSAVYSIDAVGAVCRTPVAAPPAAAPAAKRARVEAAAAGAEAEVSELVCPPQTSDSSWAGIARHTMDPSRLATALQFDRRISFLQDGNVTRTVRAQQPPTQIAYAPATISEGCVIVTEGYMMAVYDPRVASKEGCVARLRISWEPLRGLDTREDVRGVLVAGEDRRVVSVNAATWTVDSCWRSPLKHAAVATFYSRADPLQCYVGGLDHELICGDWGGDVASEGNSKLQQNFTLGFRARSRWAGLAAAPTAGAEGDVVFGFSECGALYRVGNAQRMHPLLDS